MTEKSCELAVYLLITSENTTTFKFKLFQQCQTLSSDRSSNGGLKLFPSHALSYKIIN